MNFELSHILIIFTSYLLGSFPTAKIVVGLLYKKDITKEGSGNIGTMNTYDVTGNRMTAVIVFLLDVLKGFVAVMLAQIIAGDFYSVSFAAVWVILGHNYNVFLGFRGGRGLATAVGVFLAINPFTVIIWILMWVTAYFAINKNVHIDNAVASAATPVLVFSSSAELISLMNITENFEISEYRILVLLLNIIILIRHIKPLREFLRNK
jgi:glycerol-3-phosphate acyltransferase PlsY